MNTVSGGDDMVTPALLIIVPLVFTAVCLGIWFFVFQMEDVEEADKK